MAQHDYVIANGTGAAVRSDLNNALAAIVSNNSGATEPATMYAYQWWADTSTGLLKLRNAANNAWITLRELDGTLTIEAGTVSAPGLAFASDLNTGVWSPGADQFAIATNGVERVEWGTSEVVFNDGGTNYDFRVEGDTNANLLFVDASADAVGIGTSSPGGPLDVAFTNATVYSTTTAATNAFAAINSSATTGSFASVSLSSRNTANAGCTVNLLGISTSTNNASDFAIQQRTTAGAYRENLRITHDGNVGIGTTNPAQKLDVSGAIRVLSSSSDFNTESGQIDFDSASGAARISAYKSTGSSVQFFTNSSSGTVNERARIDSSGRLLVGTSTAQGSSTVTIEQTAANSAPLALRYTSTNDNQIGIDFYRSRSSSAKVESTDPIMRLDAYGYDGSTYRKGASIEAIIDAATSAGDMPCRLVFSVTADGSASPTEAVRINSNRQLLVGASTIGATGNGIIYATGRIASEGVYNTTTASAANVTIGADYYMSRSTSSSKYKTNVETLQDNFADAILQCRPVWYRSLGTADNPDWGYWGFIAEEVAEIDPRLVQWKTVEITHDENGSVIQTPCEPEPDGVQYDRFVPHLLNLIKRQQQAIETLEAKVSALEAA